MPPKINMGIRLSTLGRWCLCLGLGFTIAILCHFALPYQLYFVLCPVQITIYLYFYFFIENDEDPADRFDSEELISQITRVQPQLKEKWVREYIRLKRFLNCRKDNWNAREIELRLQRRKICLNAKAHDALKQGYEDQYKNDLETSLLAKYIDEWVEELQKGGKSIQKMDMKYHGLAGEALALGLWRRTNWDHEDEDGYDEMF